MFPALPRTAAALAAAALIPGLIVGISTTSAHAGLIGCDGMIPTFVGDDSNEQIYGTEGPDVILALGGNDEIIALGGNDTVCGGDGDDTVYSGDGDDRVFGNAGGDNVYAGIGDDLAKGGGGGDGLFGEGGDDLLGGNTGSDFFDGGADGDQMMGGRDSDAVAYSGSARGVVVSLRPKGGADDGNAADGPAGSRDELLGIDAVFGTNFRDLITGNSKANFFLPQGGRDTVTGRGGNDFFEIADSEADQADCGDGRDDVRFDKGADTLKDCEDRNPADDQRRTGSPVWPASWVQAANL